MKKTNSHKYLRSHHTFNQDLKHGIIRGYKLYSENKKGNPVYDFSNLNSVFKSYVENGIKPIVEYDYLPDELILKKSKKNSGNDEGMTMVNTGPKDWKKWSDLMKATTQNLIDVFGAEEVRTWYFEVWNEPDGWPKDQLEVFYKMYDVFVAAVSSVDPKLKVGGPACYHEYFLKPFLNHITNGTNYVTGKKGTRIDFISYHIYGLSGKWLNQEPHIQPHVQRFVLSVLWLQRLVKDFPSLKKTEFHINEWGLSSNYYRTVADYPDLAYRNSIISPLFLVKLVNALYQIEDNYNFPTSMLLYWGFSWEADEDEFFVGKRELLTAGNTPKPIQTGFELLAKLKSKRVKVIKKTKENRFGVLATKSESEEIAFITYNFEEADGEKIDGFDFIDITLKGLKPDANYSIEVIKMNKSNNNTYQSWMSIGSPENSQNKNLGKLKKAAELKVSEQFNSKSDPSGDLILNFKIDRNSMRFYKLKQE
jgi:xylan 1,4-beta-xylosidase